MLKQKRQISAQSEKEINWISLENLLKKEIINLEDEPLQVKQFSEGYSNLTYIVRIGSWEGVLRRPLLVKYLQKHMIWKESINY